MAVDFNTRVLELYLGILAKINTIQEFIDFISNSIENNQIKNLLQTYLQKTEELEEVYNLANQDDSPRFTIQSGNNEQGEVFQYFIRKIQSDHYCLYISIPATNLLHGESYDEVPDATFASVDTEDPTRWIFGWDYTHFNMLTLSNIYFYYSEHPLELLDMQIITKDVIENDISRYVHILSGNQ